MCLLRTVLGRPDEVVYVYITMTKQRVQDIESVFIKNTSDPMISSLDILKALKWIKGASKLSADLLRA